jgi:hypothetical protein
MSKVARLVVACAGVLALSVLASTSASAATAGWMVNGTILTGSAALATTGAVMQEGVLKGSGASIACRGTTAKSVAPEIKASNKGAAQALEFTECKAEEPCKISSSTIKTLPITEEATLEGVLAVVGTIKPTTGTIFTTLKFEGTECGLSGVTPLKGQAKVLEPTGQDERTLQEGNAITTEASDELLIGSGAAAVSGIALLRLSINLSWSFL